ncbi:EamA family transporter [Novosphingobium sp. FSY-8]|uniref:EamA family transporter n=2 Tax=Novosphingobium ovatum TaxID=1908523 RepID=A0ABW9XB16_9SPHN|nr:EamA family transporter [Novosphingobium ovatum]
MGLRLCAALMVSTLFLLVKLAGQSGVKLPEIMFWRQAISLPLIGGWLAAQGQLSRLSTRRLPMHAARAVSGTIGMVCNFSASILLPLAVATILGFTTPMFAVLLSALLLREHVGPWRWVSVALGFAGVLLIALPSGGVSGINPLGVAAGIASGFMVALISIQIRDMTRTEHSPAMVFYFALFGTLVTAPLLPLYMTAHSPAQWAILMGVGLVGTAGQFLLTGALRFGAVSSVIVMDYTSLIWTTLFGEVIFNQMPPATVWLGAPLIVAAGLVIAWREHRLHLLRQRLAAQAEGSAA